MEEKEGMSLLWGVVAHLIDKIGDEVDRLNWDDALNMIADAYTEVEQETDTTKLFFTWYQFFFRFYWRIKKMDTKRPFNIISLTTRLVDHDDVEMYMVTNYDYKMYLWGRDKGCSNSITNDWFLVPKSILTPAEIKHFEERVSKNS